jgi:hypothetical protein
MHMRTGKQTTLSGEFDLFIAACYPDGVIPEQREQLKDAFIGGAWAVLDAFTNDMSEEDTIALCERWVFEAKTYAAYRSMRAS